MQILLFTQVLCAIILAGSFNADAEPNGLRIINGDIAKEHEFPFIAYLGTSKYWIPETELDRYIETGVIPNYPQKENSSCAGSIITKHHVLTAAHCVYSIAGEFWKDCIMREEDVQVFVGAHNISKLIGNGRYQKVSGVQQLGVKLIERHEKYGTDGAAYDIALLTLREPIQFSCYAQSIALYPRVRKGLQTTVIGWGLTEHEVDSEELRKFNTKIVAIRDFQFETYNSKGSSCHGDSGGPAVVNRGGTFYLAGIVSRGDEHCRIGSGVPNTLVTAHAHLPWIKSAVESSGKRGEILVNPRSPKTERYCRHK